MSSKFNPDYPDGFLPRPELEVKDCIEKEQELIESLIPDELTRGFKPNEGAFIPLSSINSYREYESSPFGRKKEYLDEKLARHISVGDFDGIFHSDCLMSSKEAQLVATAVQMVKKARSTMDGDTAWVSAGVSPEAHMTSKAEFAMHQKFGSSRSEETFTGNAEGLLAFVNAITYLTSRPEAPEEAAQ